MKRIHRRDAEYAGMPQSLAGHATFLRRLCCLCVFAVMLCSLRSYTLAQQLTRAQWGAPEVKVTQTNGKWTIAGKRNTVTLNESDLAIKVQAGNAIWQMVPSSVNDLLVRSKGSENSRFDLDSRKRYAKKQSRRGFAA